MNEPNIHSLFSTPIYRTNLERKFTQKELQFVLNEEDKCNLNEGNKNTIDSYILNRLELFDIKKYLEKQLYNYLHTIICPKDNIELCITQSWLNYTKQDQYHHRHEHPNSIVSGTLYFDADKTNDKIYFISPRQYQLMKPALNFEKFNHWNSETWWFPVETGDLIMFPSYTTHQVARKKGNNTRISLAFNSFYKGKIGSKRQLTELIL